MSTFFSKIRLVAAVSIITIFGSLLAGCTINSTSKSTSSTTNISTPITIGLTYTPDIQFAPVYVGIEKGFFQQAGLEVKMRHHGGQEPLFAALAQGNEDIVFAGGDEMAQAVSQGIKVKIFATVYQKYPLSVIVADNGKLNSLSDLGGKTLGYPGEYGESYFYAQFVRQVVEDSGQKLNEAHIGYTGPAALKTNKVDAIVGFSNNDLVQLIESNTKVKVLSLPNANNQNLPLVGASLGANEKLSNDPATIAKIQKALQKSLRYIIDNPEESVDISAKYVSTLATADAKKMALKVLKATIELYGQESQLGVVDEFKVEQMLKFMETKKILKTSIKKNDVIVKL